MTGRQRAKQCWQSYMYYQNRAAATQSITDDFYSRLALCAWFENCEEILEDVQRKTWTPWTKA
jgi:hypothetical protein